MMLNWKIVYPNRPEPFRIEIEITNICNANCTFCPRFNIKQYWIMDFEKYKSFILSLKNIKRDLWIAKKFPSENLPLIVFWWYGEPLLNKDVFKYISYARSNWFNTELISNWLLLTHDNCEKLIDAWLNRLAISLHTLNKEINKKIMKLPNTIEIIRNALTYLDDKDIIIEIWRVCNLDWSLLDPNETPDEYLNFLSSFTKNIKVLGPTPARNRWGQFKSFFYKKENDSVQVPCQTSYFTLNISYNWDFILCCCDFSGKTTILSKEWNFDFYDIQEKIKNYQFNLPSICVQCRKPKNDYYDKIFINRKI